MKIRSLMVAAIVLAGLVGVLYWSEHRKPGAETAASASTPPAILKLDQAAITRVELKKKDAEPLVLMKDSAGNWQIARPKPLRADQSAVTSMVDSLAALNSERLVEDKASDLGRYGLAQPAVEADVTGKDNKTQKLLIGDETPTGNAFFAMLAGDPRVFTMPGYAKTSIDKSANDLRDKRLLTVSPDKISRLELISKNQAIEFGRDKDEWQIVKPRPLRADSTQVGELVGKLTDARMDLSASNDDSNKIALDFSQATPVATAKVTDSSGTQELQIRKSSKDTYYAKSSVVDGAYKVDSALGQAVDKKLDDFRNKKLFDFGFNDPTKVEMHDGSKAWSFVRNGTDWWENGKKMDPGTMDTLVADLRDLSASKFVDSGLAKPTIEITVTSDDGKKVEKVSVVKSRDGFIAKRENEPTLYFVESSTVESLEKAAADVKPGAANPK